MKSKRRHWNAIDVQLLREFYPDWPTWMLARYFKRPLYSVHNKAHALGLRKSAAYLAGPDCHRKNGHEPGSVAHRFKNGLVPHNKGLRRPGWFRGRMRETQFKKGERHGAAAQRFKPVGSHRVVDGVVWRKIADHGKGNWTLDWKQVHRIVWEEAHGSVPQEHMVRFRDGMKTPDPDLVTLDRLELVTFAENTGIAADKRAAVARDR